MCKNISHRKRFPSYVVLRDYSLYIEKNNWFDSAVFPICSPYGAASEVDLIILCCNGFFI